jgi:hypothetical protein
VRVETRIPRPAAVVGITCTDQNGAIDTYRVTLPEPWSPYGFDGGQPTAFWPPEEG